MYRARTAHGGPWIEADNLADLCSKLRDMPAGTKLVFDAGGVECEIELSELRAASERGVAVRADLFEAIEA